MTLAAELDRSAPYAGGRSLPADATIEDPRSDFSSGLLLRIYAALTGLRDGQILEIASPFPTVAADLRDFERLTGHGLLSDLPDPVRASWRRFYVRKGPARTDWGTITRSAGASPSPLDLEAIMPRRLWLYTNYDCNLACDYCCVVSSPWADPRRLPAARIRDLVEEAVGLDFLMIFVTGGEPTVRADLPELIAFITDRLPLTVLTNAMLLRGPRWERLRPLVDRRISFQVSLDSASPSLHDRHRGAGSHARAIEGIRTLIGAGARVRLAASLSEESIVEIPALHRLADELGIAGDDRIFRPIALRGAATGGEAIRPVDLAPDLTCDASGFFWHPLSNDPDMRLPIAADADLGTALDEVRTKLSAMLAEQHAPLYRFSCG